MHGEAQQPVAEQQQNGLLASRLVEQFLDEFTACVFVTRTQAEADALEQLRFRARCVDHSALIADVVPGTDVVLVQVPRLPRAIVDSVRVWWTMVLPPPWQNVVEYLNVVPTQEISATRCTDLRNRWLDCVGKHAHLLGAREPPRSAIAEAWAPMIEGSLSKTPATRLWLLRHPNGDGLLPRGKVGILAAEGGSGKTLALIQLAVACAIGGRWFGHFHVEGGGRVLLALAEEDAEEAHRRLFNVCDALGLADHQRRIVEQRVIVLPLAGKSVALLRRHNYGAPVETAEVGALYRLLRQHAGNDGWQLIGLDPLVRFAGIDAESDNNQATQFTQVLEGLTEVPGKPTVLVPHHSSKFARRGHGADARGVTGLTDAARWFATLRIDGSHVLFRQVKSNYSMPMCSDLQLLRLDGGVLRAATAEELAAQEAAGRAEAVIEAQADVAAAVDALRLLGGTATSIDAIAAKTGLRLTRGRVVVKLALDERRILKGGTSRSPIYGLPPVGVPASACDVPPNTPGTPDVVRPG